MKTTKLASYSVTPALQRIFVYSALLAYLTTTVYELFMALSQISSNPNLSSYYWVSVYAILCPILFFAIAYALSDKKSKRSARVFIGALLATSGTLALSAVSSLFAHIINAAKITLSTGFWDWFGLQVGIATAFLIAYALVLVALRRTGRF